MNKLRCSFFTLIEVVIALLIFTLSVGVTLELITSARKRLIKAEQQWMDTHVLVQTAEYFLLQEEDDPGEIPAEFFPYYQQYSVVCYYDRVEDDIPDEFSSLLGQLPLKCMIIELYRSGDRVLIDQLKIDLLDYDGGGDVRQNL